MKLRDADKDYDNENENDDGDGNVDGWNWNWPARARAGAAARNLPMGCGQWTHEEHEATERQTETTDTFIANHFKCCK